MFLKFFKPTINTLRRKKKVLGFLSSYKNSFPRSFFRQRVKQNHKFLNNTNSILQLNIKNKIFQGSFCILHYLKPSYSNIFFSVCFFGNKSLNLKPAAYGFSLQRIYRNYFINSFLNYKRFIKVGPRLYKYIDTMQQNFIIFFPRNSLCFFFRDFFSNQVFAKSAGTFCVYLLFNRSKAVFLIKLPSKKKKYFDLFCVGFFGRCSNIFAKYSYFSSFKQKQIIKKHHPKVRGIAQNPVDHPNGGSSKTKQPMRNPWFKIAKCGK